MRYLFIIIIFCITGCSSWSTATYKPAKEAVSFAGEKTRSLSEIVLTGGDLGKRQYRVLGEVQAKVRKSTLFHRDPTRHLVAMALKKKAAEIGADAVIFTRYGSPGFDVMTWGAMEGRGRAVAFID